MKGFERTDLEEEVQLRFTHGTSHVWDALDGLERTGWVMRGIPEPETVAEHTRAVRMLAIELAPELELSEEELDDLLDILEVHDWPEAIVGDVVVLGTEPDAEDLKQAKKEAEAKALDELTADMLEGEAVRTLYERYEKGTDKVASLARQIDKLQAVLQAREYETQYDMFGLTAEFVEYSKKYISEPLLVARMEACL